MSGSRRRRWSLVLAGVVACGLALVVSPANADGLQVGEGNWTRLHSYPLDDYAGMAALPDGRIAFAGTYRPKAAIFDPESDTVRKLPDMIVARPYPAVVPLTGGRIAVLGGMISNAMPNYPDPPGGEIYDPTTDSWTAIAGAPAFNGRTSVGELTGGRFIVSTRSASAVWTPATNTFESVDGAVGEGDILVTGDGRTLRFDDDFNGNASRPLVEFDEQAMTWRQVATVPIAHPPLDSLFQVDPDHLMAVGGTPGKLWREKAVLIDLRDFSMVEVSPRADRPDNENTQFCAFAALPDHTVIAMDCRGGYRSMVAFDPATSTWRELPNSSPVNRATPTLTTPEGIYLIEVTSSVAHVALFAPGPYVPTIPDAPTLHLQPCCSGGVTLRWDAADMWHDGGVPVTSYRITRSGPDGDVEFTTDQATFTDPEVTAGGLHTYTVRAVNSVGEGPGAVWIAKDGDAPSPIRNLSADGNGRVVLTWEPPESSGGSPIVGYDIFRMDKYDGSGPTETVDGSAVTYVDTDVAVGTDYTYYVIPRNADGYDALAIGRYQDLRSVSVTVREANDGSVVAADSYQIVRGSALLNIDAHDTDGDPLTFDVKTGPNHGTLSGEYPNITYHPDAGYVGRDSVTYKVTSPGAFATATATVSVREPLVANGEGWTQTTIHDVDRWDEMMPYSVAVDDQGTVFFPVVNIATGVGAVVAQAPDGSQTPTAWTVDPWYVNFPIAMDADGAGNLYGMTYVDGDRYWPRVLRAGSAEPQDLPFPDLMEHQAGTFPAIAASASGDVAVSDWFGRKVYVLPAGSSQSIAMPLPAGFYPLDLDIGRDDALYVVGYTQESNQTTTEVLRMALDGSGTQVTRVNGWAIGIAVADDGTIYLAGAGAGADHLKVGRMDAVGDITPVSTSLELYTGSNSLETDRHGSVYAPEIWGDRVVRIDFPDHNAPPVAADSQRSVRGDQSSGLVLSASDPDGDVLTYAVTEDPQHGSLSGTAPDLTYTPDAGYTGPDAVGYTVDDGKGGSAHATVSVTVTDPETGVSSVSQPVVEGQTVTTGAEPTADEPIQAAVTTPVAGDVTITQDPSVADPSGYAVVGTQYRIEAPQASTQAPLRLQFEVSADQLPDGQTAADLVVFRDGVPIESCVDDSGTAAPDPCIASRTTSGGVVTITVLSSHASAWTVAVRQLATTTTMAPVAPSTYGQAISLTATVGQAGSTGPTGSVEFRDTSVSPAQVVGTATVGVDGAAVLPNVRLDAGDHAIVAAYSGSATSLPSVSAPVTVSVAKAPVVVSTKASAGLLSVLTFKVTYSTTVTSGVTGQPVAGVTVTTRINGGAATTGCTAVTNTKGVATCSAGPINIALGATYTASAAASANHKAGSATGKMPLL